MHLVGLVLKRHLLLALLWTCTTSWLLDIQNLRVRRPSGRLYLGSLRLHQRNLRLRLLDLRLRDGGDPLRGGGERPNRDDRGGEERRPLPNLAREENVPCQLQNLYTTGKYR